MKINFIDLKELEKVIGTDLIDFATAISEQMKIHAPKDQKSLMRGIKVRNRIGIEGNSIFAEIALSQPYSRKQDLDELYHLPNASDDSKGSISSVGQTMLQSLTSKKQKFTTENKDILNAKRLKLKNKMDTVKDRQRYFYQFAYRRLKKDNKLVKYKMDFSKKAFEDVIKTFNIIQKLQGMNIIKVGE
jgi:hypothetical protein